VLRRLEGHTSWVNNVAFSPDGRQLLSASDDFSVRLWSVADGTLEALVSVGGQAVALGFRPFGRGFSFTDGNGLRSLPPIASVWETPPRELLAQAEADAGMRLVGSRLVAPAQPGATPTLTAPAPPPDALVLRGVEYGPVAGAWPFSRTTHITVVDARTLAPQPDAAPTWLDANRFALRLPPTPVALRLEREADPAVLFVYSPWLDARIPDSEIEWLPRAVLLRMQTQELATDAVLVAGEVLWGGGASPSDAESVACAEVTSTPPSVVEYQSPLLYYQPLASTGEASAHFVLGQPANTPFTLTVRAGALQKSVSYPGFPAGSLVIAPLHFDRTEAPQNPSCIGER